MRVGLQLPSFTFPGGPAAIRPTLTEIAQAAEANGFRRLAFSIGGLLLINVLFTFAVPGISIGGHLGGLAAGALGGLAVRAIGEGSDLRRIALTTALLAVLTAGLFLGARPVAGWRCAQESSEVRKAYRGSSVSIDQLLAEVRARARAQLQGIDPCP